jgi:hypothetical protein
MDISNIVNWGTLAIWLFASVLYIIRVATGERTMHPWLKWALSSNIVLGAIIAMGLVTSCVTLYPTAARLFGWQSTTVTMSAYNPDVNNPLKIVSGQTFENADVPLDGYSYNDCTFINSCLLYDGGAYQLQNATFKSHWKVCVRDPKLKNYNDLTFALDLAGSAKKTSKTLIVPRSP